MNRPVGLVLAGGKSSRMGSPKHSLKIGRKTFLQHAIEMLASGGVDKVFVSGNFPGAIPDKVSGKGPLMGILTLASLLKSGTPAIIVPVDMPLMSPKYIRTLLDQVGNQRAAHFENYELPAYFLVDNVFLRTVETCLYNGTASVRELHKRCGSLALPVYEDIGSFKNINSKSDYVGVAEAHSAA